MDKDYFELKFKIIADSIDKLNNKMSKLFETTDLHHDQLVLQERDIKDLKTIELDRKKATEKTKDRTWSFVLTVASRVIVLIAVCILAYFQISGS